MAFRQNTGVTLSVAGIDLNTFANVDFAVGPKSMGGINLTSDTQLVQFLLNFIMQEVPDLPILDRSGKVMRTIPVDGVFTARTFDAIKGFQTAVRGFVDEDGRKASILVDGVVNSANASGVSTISGTVYTIVWLNIARVAATGEPLDEDQVSVEPLRSSLREIRNPAGFEPAPNPNPLPPPPPPPLRNF